MFSNPITSIGPIRLLTHDNVPQDVDAFYVQAAKVTVTKEDGSKTTLKDEAGQLPLEEQVEHFKDFAEKCFAVIYSML